jgi:ferredoxin hydrogenase large subunit/hydrogenase large subunit
MGTETTRIELSPVTRIEGHLAIHTQAKTTADGAGRRLYRIVEARSAGEMFRGFEMILEGRDPLDAQQIVQRICGVCPIAHGLASVRAQEMAYGIQPSPNGRLLQNLILAADTLQSHILHFYQFTAVDFVDTSAILQYAGQDATLRKLKAWLQTATAGPAGTRSTLAGAPLFPRFEGKYADDLGLNCAVLAHYAEALEVRRMAHEMGAVFAGRMPHAASIIPGGCTQAPTEEGIKNYRTRLDRVRRFVEHVLLPDVIATARAFPQYWEMGTGYGHMLCYGGMELGQGPERLFGPGVLIGGKWATLDQAAITEEVASSWFSSASGLPPARGRTMPAPQKPGAYSWLKAPRYRGLPMEVGPLARILVNCHAPGAWPGKQEVDLLLGRLGVRLEKLVSVLGRIACRGLEAVLIARQAARWLDQLDPKEPAVVDFKPAERAAAFGLVEAPRGALGHWLEIENGKIARYQCVVPTTWNFSPRDDAGRPGPVEKALEGLEVADPEQPLEVGRVARSFDPCLACAVH